MKTSDELSAYLVDLGRHIQSARLEEVDFDRLVERLDELTELINHHDHVNTELEILRADYCSRISGMLKAIAVAGRKDRELESAHEQIESLDQLTAEGLVTAYRRTQARFHDAFPASFGIIRQFHSAGKRNTHYNAFK